MEAPLKSRTAVLTIVAVISLGAAGYAAANGHVPAQHGKPSVTPPPWSHGHHYGDGQGDGHGLGRDGHGHAGGNGQHSDR